MDVELRIALAELGAPKWWFLRLPEKLERSFNAQTTAGRNRQIQFWIGISLFFYWMCFALEFIAVPDRIWLSFWVRLGFMTPLAVLSIVMLQRQVEGWRQTFWIVVSPTLATLAQLCIFMSSARVDPLLDTIVLGLEVLWMNVMFPMRLREAVLFSVVTMGVGNIINLWSAALHHADLQYPNVVVAAHGLVILSILGRAVSEQNLRRSFLKGLQLHHHVEDLSRANTKLLELSNTDPLTGVANRRYFDRALDQAWTEAVDSLGVVAVMMIDVDHFKLFNDTAGHLEGDRCLAIIAKTISQQLREGQDLVARFGGEEFVVLMPGAGLDLAEKIALRVRAAIAAQRVFHPAKIGNGFVSVSIGVAATRPGTDKRLQTSLVAEADQAMYAAKTNGRNRVISAATGASDYPQATEVLA